MLRSPEGSGVLPKGARGSGVLPKGALLVLTGVLCSPRGMCGDLNILTIRVVGISNTNTNTNTNTHKHKHNAYITCMHSSYEFMHPFECVALIHSVQHIGHHCVALRHIHIRIDIP